MFIKAAMFIRFIPILLGLITTPVGLLAIASSQVTTFACSRIESVQEHCELTSKQLLDTTTQTILLADIQEATVDSQFSLRNSYSRRNSDSRRIGHSRQDSYSEGIYTYRVVFVPTQGEIPFTDYWTSDLDEKQAIANQVNTYLQDRNQSTLLVEQDDRLLSYSLGGLLTSIGLIAIGIWIWLLFPHSTQKLKRPSRKKKTLANHHSLFSLLFGDLKVVPLVFALTFTPVGVLSIVLFGENTTLTCSRLEPIPPNCQLTTHSLVGTKTQGLLLAEIQEIRVDRQRSSRSRSGSRGGSYDRYTYRVVFVTEQGDLPLTNSWSSGQRSKEAIATQINHYLQDPSQPTLFIQQDERLFGYLFGGLFVSVGLIAMGVWIWLLLPDSFKLKVL